MKVNGDLVCARSAVCLRPHIKDTKEYPLAKEMFIEEHLSTHITGSGCVCDLFVRGNLFYVSFQYH